MIYTDEELMAGWHQDKGNPLWRFLICSWRDHHWQRIRDWKTNEVCARHCRTCGEMWWSK
jgi:hypothetical protein